MKQSIKKAINSLADKNKTFRTLYRKYKSYKKKRDYRNLSNQISVDEKLVIFESFLGKRVACSPKALYLEMLKDEKYLGFHFVWSVNNVKKHTYLKNNRDTQVVKRISTEYHKQLAKAKYIVFNSGVPVYAQLKPEQVYVQTWHGTPLKRLGCDIEVSGSAAFNLEEIKSQYTSNGRRFTYLLSPSAYATDKLSSAFGLTEDMKKTKIIEAGYPRNDALYQYTKEQTKSFKNSLGIPSDKKVILYAPTFRDNNFEFAVGFHYNGKMDFDKLREAVGEECVLLFRAHSQIADKFDFAKYEGFIWNVSNYEDINELYSISDMLITDYSSVFYDYANLKRPMVFYMYDLDEYQNNIRDFYMDLDELPGPIVKTQENLHKAISDMLKGFVYDNKYKSFNEKFNYLDGANCSAVVLEKIVEV